MIADPIGVFPGGGSPEVVDEFTRNVYEWTSSVMVMHKAEWTGEDPQTSFRTRTALQTDASVRKAWPL